MPSIHLGFALYHALGRLCPPSVSSPVLRAPAPSLLLFNVIKVAGAMGEEVVVGLGVGGDVLGRLKVNLVGHLIALATFLISHFFFQKSETERESEREGRSGSGINWLALKMHALKLS